MVWFLIIGALILFLTGYFVGSNNPTSSVKKKIIDELNKSNK